MKMAKNTDLISLFISERCSLLDIRKPKIEYKPQDFFPTSTMLAMCDSKGTVMYLRSSDKTTPDLLFAIAHELRHCWQIVNDPEMSEGYRQLPTTYRSGGLQLSSGRNDKMSPTFLEY